jgi:hypothetical protein
MMSVFGQRNEEIDGWMDDDDVSRVQSSDRITQ